MTEESAERRAFACDQKVLDSLSLTLDDLDDPDTRAFVIRAEHPDIDDALRAGRDMVEMEGMPVNARLHLTMYEVVGGQLWDNEPPETWETAQRLSERGYDRHEILHMLASTMTHQIWTALHEGEEPDPSRHVAALRALPGSWERERAARAAERRHAEAHRSARHRPKRRRTR